MFEIRVICQPTDTDHVVAALDRTFTTGTVTVHPNRDSTQHRLYLHADHLPTEATEINRDDWPTPEQAYADAPSIVDEIGWVARNARTVATGEQHLAETEFAELEREFFLRKAAVLDRISLEDDPTTLHAGAADVADAAALYLMDRDAADEIDPRNYVRREYAAWAKSQ
ncbi:hypothetical protein [Streptomyces sp. NPDC058308]|uniref:hypothetical protein n=1 Tax=Streptomyces sp. NPDC058308 TaxID=3346440 RepID=UPI0036E94616